MKTERIAGALFVAFGLFQAGLALLPWSSRLRLFRLGAGVVLLGALSLKWTPFVTSAVLLSSGWVSSQLPFSPIGAVRVYWSLKQIKGGGGG